MILQSSNDMNIFELTFKHLNLAKSRFDDGQFSAAIARGNLVSALFLDEAAGTRERVPQVLIQWANREERKMAVRSVPE